MIACKYLLCKPMAMKFLVSNPFVKTLKADKSARLELDLDDPREFGKALEFMHSAMGSYTIEIKPADVEADYLDEL